MRAGAATPQLCVTTTGGFASLWLIPRLRGFTALHPQVDVRIAATYEAINLERSHVDVAVRYSREADAPHGAVRLFGEELYPVCSPALQRQGVNPLLRLDDLRHHALLHMADADGFLDWETWLAAQGLGEVKQQAALRFNSYEQMIQAALGGQGVALGIDRLVRQLLDDGRLVAPFSKSLLGARAYFVIRSSLTGRRAHVQAFVDWLIAEARAVTPVAALSSRPPEARSGDAARRARSGT
jgi:DNA-binding transcriptional LysR family regulator